MSCPVTQWQILSKDPDGAAAFYGDLFGWRVSADNPMGYRTVDTGTKEGIAGGIWPSPPEGHSVVQLFIRVDSVEDYVRRAEGLGARAIIPPQTLPQGEVMAILLDPQGVSFGLVGR
ncbi:MAG TPA: VOC family protein [Thermoanaerobaculia bacterium]|jgi:predicted enzyme related to lactoylglutathione lyase